MARDACNSCMLPIFHLPTKPNLQCHWGCRWKNLQTSLLVFLGSTSTWLRGEYISNTSNSGSIQVIHNKTKQLTSSVSMSFTVPTETLHIETVCSVNQLPWKQCIILLTLCKFVQHAVYMVHWKGKNYYMNFSLSKFSNAWLNVALQ